MTICPICKNNEQYLTHNKEIRCLSCNRNARKLSIKPLSVNESYKGRKFPTKKLSQYKRDLSYLLPKLEVPKEGKLAVKYIFGVSSKCADGDNLIKAFQDCISEAYYFNDVRIYQWEIEKVDVKKGEEFIYFDIWKL